MKTLTTLASCLLLLAWSGAGRAQDAPVPKPKSLGELLREVRAGWKAEDKELKKREAEFLADKSKQKALLRQAKAELASEQKRSTALEREFDSNEALMAQLEETLQTRLGTMGELFGVIRQVAGEVRGHLEGSMTSAQFPDRGKELAPLASSKKLPSLEELRTLWFLMQQEMVESGKVVRFPTTVVTSGGEEERMPVIRVGVFDALAQDKYLVWSHDKLIELVRQPVDRYLSTVADFSDTDKGYALLAVDPSRGQLLSQLVETPTFWEQIPFGGIIGYITIAIGVAAFVLGLLRLLVLGIVSLLVAHQKRSKQIGKRNPLGRILLVRQENAKASVETLELKLDEAILRESAKLERFLWAIKIVSVVAPLLGLLGTVTGMIQTFQTITMFGTGDPRMMAGGISEALVTTMIGLIVAIPLVLLHSWMVSISRSITEVLEQQSAGIVAQRAEEEEEQSGDGAAG